ncbi:hypothetical protein CR513_42438, partial [Mucuna pruriens]
MALQGPDFDKIFHFLSICILAFINEGSSYLSSAFMNEPWSWGLSIPISLYVKFALEIHSHLGICVGIGVPSLVYWGATRGAIDWYWQAALKFNHEIFKTCLFNIVIGLLHLLVSKLAHYVIEWVRDHKVKKGFLSHWLVISNLDLDSLSEHPLLRPISFKNLFLKLFELLTVFFYNGNILLLSWCFSGQIYSHEVGKAISWVSLGSSMFVWIKALLRELGMQQEPPEEKACKKVVMEKDNCSSIQSVETKDQTIICSSEYDDDVQKCVNNTKQAEGAIELYYNTLQGLWREINFRRPNPMKQRSSYGSVNSSRGISNPRNKGAAMDGEGCTHCENKKHTRDTCFKLHGYLECWHNLKAKKSREIAASLGRVVVVTA